ncbi:glycosyltransferase [Patescibacteria group bacterium]|nr:glycosyltransferase [Patescibacteria group bacterium]
MNIKNKRDTRFYFFALGVTGTGISGGDRIFIELARRWCKKHSLTIYTSYEGIRLCRTQNLKGERLKIKSTSNKAIENLFIVNYLYKILAGIKLGLTFKLDKTESAYLYPASDFWMDVFPAVLVKLRYPNSKLIATWYQTAPNPVKGFAEGAREKAYTLSAFLYWFAQLPVKPLINMFADKVIVNNTDEKKRFPKFTEGGNSIVLIGAVPLADIRRWQKKNRGVKKEYDGVFQGRFHPQKGVVELIDIWKKVVVKRHNAKLGMIGDGPLMGEVKDRIKKHGLEKNIKLLGYVFDGDKKNRLFASGRVVLHPAFYDSGGMAAAEAMAFGLPCVGFNLKAYESYYPKGMVKAKIGDIEAFSNKVLKLLSNNEYWKRIAKEAREMIGENWSWEKRSEEVLRQIAS